MGTTLKEGLWITWMHDGAFGDGCWVVVLGDAEAPLIVGLCFFRPLPVIRY